jgi:hypothetical protein
MVLSDHKVQRDPQGQTVLMVLSDHKVQQGQTVQIIRLI